MDDLSYDDICDVKSFVIHVNVLDLWFREPRGVVTSRFLTWSLEQI